MSKAAVWADPYAVARVVQAVTAVKEVADKLKHYFCVVSAA